MTKSSKWLCLVGSSFLLIMAGFHGSGLSYIKGVMDDSNAKDFLKEIMPVLFAHPSLHLAVLAIFGFFAPSFKEGANNVLLLIAVLVLVDSLLAFYLAAILPGILLLTAGLAFFMAAQLNQRKLT